MSNLVDYTSVRRVISSQRLGLEQIYGHVLVSHSTQLRYISAISSRLEHCAALIRHLYVAMTPVTVGTM